MPSVVSTGSHPLCSGAERAQGLVTAPSRIPGYGCSFAHGAATVWAIIAERLTKMQSLLLDRRALTLSRNKEGAVWGRFPSPASGAELVRNVDHSTAALMMTGGARAHGE
jgi:hypothetical protein